MSINFRFAARTDVGLIRKNNQDTGYAGPHLLVLADGMGGAAGGDTASSVTVSHLAPLDDVHRADDLLPILRDAVTSAHEDLVDMAHEDSKLSGMGTTCIALLRSGNKIAMIHIGDSRAYVLHDGSMRQVTKDHTLVQYLLDHGQITPEEAENHPKKNVIMRALGDTQSDVELDESIREAIVGDRWLLCSDGLFGVVSDETIASTLAGYEDLDACADKLIDLALASGAPDNVTVVLADVLDSRDLTTATAPSTNAVVVGAAAVDRNRPSRGGRSAAAKASALNAPIEIPEEKEPEPAAPKKRWAARFAVLAGLIVLVAGGLFSGWQWTQSQYYVYSASGNVGIYRGIPQAIGPLELSSLVERTDIELDTLNETARRRLREPVSRDSLEDAQTYVRDLEEEYRREQTADDRAEEKRAQEREETTAPTDEESEPAEESPSESPSGAAPGSGTSKARPGADTSASDFFDSFLPSGQDPTDLPGEEG